MKSAPAISRRMAETKKPFVKWRVWKENGEWFAGKDYDRPSFIRYPQRDIVSIGLDQMIDYLLVLKDE